MCKIQQTEIFSTGVTDEDELSFESVDTFYIIENNQLYVWLVQHFCLFYSVGLSAAVATLLIPLPLL